jgi:hypothetical protein
LKPENVLLHYSLPKLSKRKRDEDKKDSTEGLESKRIFGIIQLDRLETQKKMETEIKQLSIKSEEPKQPEEEVKKENEEKMKEEPKEEKPVEPSHIVFRDVVEEDVGSWK